MKATALEFRLRYLIHTIVYVLGFLAPWDRLLHLDRDRTAWLLLAAWPASNHWLNFTAATVTLLIIGILCALAAASLRTWAAAYLDSSIVKAHTLALALLMPPSGAVFCIVLSGLFQLRLIAGEEAYLTGKLGELYLAYRAKVPALLPALTPRVPASPTQPKWSQAFLGEIYFWGVFLAFVIAGWRYNAFLIIQGVLISLGVSLVARAFVPKR